jgi:aerobic carbon-monoxide dehydrogenase medium subunit
MKQLAHLPTKPEVPDEARNRNGMAGARYHRATTLEEVLALLDQFGTNAKILAGGQSLVPMMSAGFITPELLVDINHVPDLGRVILGNGAVRVGALVRHRALEFASGELSLAVPLLPAAAPFIAHAPIRNRGTFAGSLVHADPSGEWPAVALATEAQVRLVSLGGERLVRAEDMFIGPLTADVEPNEIATEVIVPSAPTARTGVSVQELAYRVGDYAVVGVVAQISLDQDGNATHVRLALFGVDATPLRIIEAEAAILQAGAAGIEDAARIAAASANPSSDATASASYRRDMIAVYCRRALREALAGAGHSSSWPEPRHVAGI